MFISYALKGYPLAHFFISGWFNNNNLYKRLFCEFWGCDYSPHRKELLPLIPKYIFVRNVFFGYELKLLISTAGGRFPRAWLEPPRSLRSLWGLKAHAIPVGQGELRQHYIARRKSVCIFEESPPSVPINDAVLRIMNKLKRLWN